jgi:hypothetical protein
MVIPDKPLASFKAELLGTIFSAIAYGIVIVLSGNCFHLLHRKRGIYSNRMRIILLIYITVMPLLSTWALIQSIWSIMAFISPRNTLPTYRTYMIIALPFTIWGADGLMVSILIICREQRDTMQSQIWRCVVLYQDVSKGPRLAIIILLSLLAFACFGRSICIYSPAWISFKLLMKNTRIRCHSASRSPESHQGNGVFRNNVHFRQHSRQYHTRGVDRFLTHLPSKTCPKCSWSGTWISLHQHYNHVCRIFNPDGRYQWRIPGSVQHEELVFLDPILALPSHLRRWPRTL